MTDQQRPLVVGIDDSLGAEAAVRWALDDAGRRGAPVRLVHTFQWHYTYAEIPAYGFGPTYAGLPSTNLQHARQVAEQLVANLVSQARATAPDVEVDGLAVDGGSIPTLLAESASADLLVLGSRHLKALGSEVLGSVSAAVAARATCPTVVVRGPAGPADEGAAVVIGVDGTSASRDLLRFGFQHASRHGTPVHAVLCWHPDLLATMQWRPEPPAPERAQAWLAGALARWRARYPDVPVVAEVRSGITRWTG